MLKVEPEVEGDELQERKVENNHQPGDFNKKSNDNIKRAGRANNSGSFP